MIDFRSDTVTRPTAAMREAMASAPVGDDVYGEDPTVNALQQEAAAMLGFDAALFAPSGTQTNLIALMAQCERGDEAIVGQQWHTYRFEGGGLAVLGSIQPQVVENRPDGTLALDDIAAAIKPDDPHFARTRLIALENTTGGKVLPLAWLGEVAELARSRQLRLHLDGARLFNAAVRDASTHYPESSGNGVAGPEVGRRPDRPAIARAARRICEHFDTVSVCLSKGLGAPVGSLVLGSRETIGRAMRIRKLLGGGMRQAGILAAAGLHALENHLERLGDDHDNARRLALGLREIASRPGHLCGQLQVSPPETNIVFVQVGREIAPAFQQALGDNGIQVTGNHYLGGHRQRWVTHLDIDRNDVDRALTLIAGWSASGAAG